MGTQDPLIKSIISCAYTVAKELGYGFSCEVYINALAVELRKAKWEFVQNKDLNIFYEGVCVGTSQADLIIEERVLVSVGIEDRIDSDSIAKCRNDMKASCLVSGLMIGFRYGWMEVRQVGVISEEGIEHWITDSIEVV